MFFCAHEAETPTLAQVKVPPGQEPQQVLQAQEPALELMPAEPQAQAEEASAAAISRPYPQFSGRRSQVQVPLAQVPLELAQQELSAEAQRLVLQREPGQVPLAQEPLAQELQALESQPDAQAGS